MGFTEAVNDSIYASLACLIIGVGCIPLSITRCHTPICIPALHSCFVSKYTNKFVILKCCFFVFLYPLSTSLMKFHLTQESLERCAVADWSCLENGMCQLPSRHSKWDTLRSRGVTSYVKPALWDNLTILMSFIWRESWREVNTMFKTLNEGVQTFCKTCINNRFSWQSSTDVPHEISRISSFRCSNKRSRWWALIKCNEMYG